MDEYLTSLDAICLCVLTFGPPQVFFSPRRDLVFMSVPTFSSGSLLARTFATLLLLFVMTGVAHAQSEDSFGDIGADPVKLFERGQTAHGRGDLAKALELYEEAIKIRPEFAEAEFQRASVLVALGRLTDAEKGLRRAIAIKKDWALPYSQLGSLLVRLNREKEAESSLREALTLDNKSNLALRLLADIRLRAGDSKEALELASRATTDPDAPVATWLLKALAQRANGDTAGALVSLDHMLQVEPLQFAALLERADIRIAAGEKDRALIDLAAAEPLVKADKGKASRLASAYERAGKPDEGLRIAKTNGLVEATPSNANGTKGVNGTPQEIEAANSDDPDVARKALETLLQKNPKSAMLMARLGDSYRKVDPARSLDFYRRALELEPSNANYATGYSSALVQARRFPEAVAVLRQVIAKSPDSYAAHANLATALYSLKAFADALTEYQWLLAAKPDLSIAHYFIATAHDNLGEYEPALVSYELFLAKADATANELEIEKVKLRLPSLRRQIQLGQGVKKEKSRKP